MKSAAVVVGLFAALAVAWAWNDRAEAPSAAGSASSAVASASSPLRCDPAPTAREAAPVPVASRVTVESAAVPNDLVEPGPHLAVRVMDGRSACIERLAVGLERGFGRGLPRRWPGETRLIVFPVRREAHLHPHTTLDFEGVTTETHEHVFEVPDDRSYLVGLLGGDAAWEPREVFVAPGAERVELELEPRTAGARAVLLVSAFDHDANAVKRGVVIRVEEPATGAPVVERSTYHVERWPARFELPEGDYRLVVRGAASINNHGVLMRPRAHGRFETRVRLSAPTPTRVAAILTEGARVQLKLVGSALPEDLRTIEREHRGATGLEYRARLADVLLIADGDWPQPVWFTRALGPSAAAGTERRARLEIGSEQTSQLLSAGRYVLQARMAGGRVRTRTLTLIDGRTHAVELTFD